jgi:hypothetical protein
MCFAYIRWKGLSSMAPRASTCLRPERSLVFVDAWPGACLLFPGASARKGGMSGVRVYLVYGITLYSEETPKGQRGRYHVATLLTPREALEQGLTDFGTAIFSLRMRGSRVSSPGTQCCYTGAALLR